MSRYRRAATSNASYFFTVVTFHRYMRDGGYAPDWSVAGNNEVAEWE
jgi:hypothetical protein